MGAFFVRDLNLATLVSYGGDRTPMVAFGAAIGALLWISPLRRLLAGLVGLLALAFAVVAFTPLSAWMNAGLPRRDALAPADAVFVSSSRLQEDGELTTTAMNRLVHGLEVVGSGSTGRLILSELRPPHPSYAAAARTMMERLGLRPELLVVGPVTIPGTRPSPLRPSAASGGLTRIIVVTSPPTRVAPRRPSSTRASRWCRHRAWRPGSTWSGWTGPTSASGPSGTCSTSAWGSSSTRGAVGSRRDEGTSYFAVKEVLRAVVPHFICELAGLVLARELDAEGLDALGKRRNGEGDLVQLLPAALGLVDAQGPLVLGHAGGPERVLPLPDPTEPKARSASVVRVVAASLPIRHSSPTLAWPSMSRPFRLGRP